MRRATVVAAAVISVAVQLEFAACANAAHARHAAEESQRHHHPEQTGPQMSAKQMHANQPLLAITAL